MKSPSDLEDTSFNDDWIKKTGEDSHPVLAIPYDEGLLLVIGSTQKFLHLEAQQQIELGLKIIERANRRKHVPASVEPSQNV